MYQHILVPIDDSPLCADLIRKATDFAKRLGARLTFIQASQGTAAPVIAASSCASAAGVPSSTITRHSDRPYEEIIDAAQSHGCDLIFLAFRGRGNAEGMVLDADIQKLLAHTTIPVLLSTTDSHGAAEVAADSARPAADLRSFAAVRNGAIAVIEGEHRSIAAVMQAMKHLLAQARESGDAMDIPTLRAIVKYLRTFPDALHHPKEEEFLFSRLMDKAPEVGSLLADLTQQHLEEEAKINAIEKALDDYVSAGAAAPLAPLVAAANAYTQHIWSHMNAEEKYILPACRNHFSADDWQEIASAFASNDDPRFDRDQEAGLDTLLARIQSTMNATASGAGRAVY